MVSSRERSVFTCREDDVTCDVCHEIRWRILKLHAWLNWHRHRIRTCLFLLLLEGSVLQVRTFAAGGRFNHLFVVRGSNGSLLVLILILILILKLKPATAFAG